MYLKYGLGSLKNHSKDVNYHMLTKTLKFATTKMQCAQDNQENFIWVAMWARRVRERSQKMYLGLRGAT